jgi:hypothetical protein
MWDFKVNPIRNEEVGVKKYQFLEKKSNLLKNVE